MKQKTLYIMSAPPGAGKSYWLAHNATGPYDIVISRDKIRYELVSEKENYFSKEKLVFNTYIQRIQDALNDPIVENVYCDATQVSVEAQDKVIKKLNLTNVADIKVIRVSRDLSTVLAQNAKRFGRERVPKTAVCKMYESWANCKPKYETIIV